MFYSLLCDYFKSYNSSNIYLWYFSTYCGSHSCINSLIHTYCIIVPIVLCYNHYWYLCSAPPPFRPGNPALCGSCPLVTPYQCRLGDLLCYTYMLCLSTILCVYAYVFFVFSFVFWGCFPLQLSPSVLWYCWLGLLICKNRLPYNLHCVGGDVKHCTIQSMLSVSLQRNESLTFYRQPFVTTLIVNLFQTHHHWVFSTNFTWSLCTTSMHYWITLINHNFGFAGTKPFFWLTQFLVSSVVSQSTVSIKSLLSVNPVCGSLTLNSWKLSPWLPLIMAAAWCKCSLTWKHT